MFIHKMGCSGTDRLMPRRFDVEFQLMFLNKIRFLNCEWQDKKTTVLKKCSRNLTMDQGFILARTARPALKMTFSGF